MNEEEKKAVEKFRKLGIKKFREEKLKSEDLLSYFEFVIILNLIEKLQKENEELKKFHIQDNKHLDFIMENSITVQKVKDKISERQFELQQEYKDFEDDAILIVLQELLEGRK